MRSAFLFLVFSCSIYLSPAGAQSPHPSFKAFTVDDGLPSSEVYQVKQDSKGYIWFATGNGVSRFNGYEFENFSLNNGLPDNTVFEIFEDPSERIWFLPISCKLSYYYDGKIYLYKYNDALQKVLNNPVKSSFVVTADGTVFLGVSRNGIYEVKPDGTIIHHLGKTEEEKGINILQADRNHLIYASNELASSNYFHFNTDLIKGSLAIPDDVAHASASIRAIITKKRRTVVSCQNRVYVFKDLGSYITKALPKKIIWLYEDSDEDLWVGTYLGGVYHFPKGNLDNAANYLPGLPVNGVLRDHEGGYWFATEGNGVFYALSKNITVLDETSGIEGKEINCFTTDGKNLFAGSRRGMVYMIGDSSIRTFNANISTEAANNIGALFYDPLNKRLSVSGKSACGNFEKEKFISDDHEFGLFNRVLIDDSSHYWVAASNSMSHSNTVHNFIKVANHEQELKRVNALIMSPHNTLMLGTLDGLWEFYPSQRKYTYLGNRDSLLSTRILDLAYINDSCLVIGTKGRGILLYKNEKVFRIDSRNGLCGDNVHKVAVNDSVIWVATNKGVNKITLRPGNSFQYQIKKINTSDGLSSNEINDIILFKGKIWAATSKGINVFDDNESTHTDTGIPLYIRKIMINDVQVPVSGYYELEHDQNNIAISYIGVGYRNAGELIYRYRLRGLDTAWTDTRVREVRFNTLPPDNYTLDIRVLDAEGNYKGAVAFAFMIKPAFWQKWWFRMLITLIVVFLLYLFFRYRINLERRREIKNSEQNRVLTGLKLKALRAQMNPHFTFNVMNSIQHFILNKDEESAHRYLSKFSKLIRAILNNSESNTIPLSEELKALELYIELEAIRFENSFHYEIIIDKKIDPSAIQIPSMLIQPYVENAIKHGILPLKENGRIKIEIVRQDSLLKCTVEDNGIGREKSAEYRNNNQHTSMGISLTKERLVVINALNNSNLSERIIDLKDESGRACGTKVEIYIPIS